MGKQISSEDMAITLLSHLPAKYSNFYSSLITSGRLNEILWEELVPMVLDQEDRFQQQGKSGTSEALSGQQNQQSKGKGKSNQKSSGGGNQRSKPQKSKEERDAVKAQRHCNNCGELGHYW